MSHLDNYTISIAKDSDAKDWNAFVENSKDSTPYHRFAWMKAVETSYGHKPVGIVARNAENEVIGILPMVELGMPLLGKSAVSLPYCDLGFAIAESDKVQKDVVDFALKNSITTGAKSTQIRKLNKAVSEDKDFTGQKVRMVLPLPESSETLMASFKSKLRSQIRKAEKNGLTFKTGVNEALLRDFYHVYSVNMRDLGSPAHSYQWFVSIIKEYQDNAIISVVYLDDTPTGAGIVLKNAESAVIPWASTIQEFNRLAPNMLLYWSLLSHCADNNITQFDFGRSTFNEGTFKFKKQWGAQPELLAWEDFDQSGSLRASNDDSESNSGPGKMRGIVESIWRKLPLGLSIKLGAFVRPYISL